MRDYRPIGMTAEQTVEYFLDSFCRFPENPDCWELYRTTRNSQGYPSIWWKDRMVLAHRFFYETRVGPIPEGKFLLHKCDNPLCVNPDHMFIGTQSDNMRDMARKGRTGVCNGSANTSSKLSEADVISIRMRAAAGDVLNNLAKEYDVTSIVISKIVRGLSWRHVDGPITIIGKGRRNQFIRNRET